MVGKPAPYLIDFNSQRQVSAFAISHLKNVIFDYFLPLDSPKLDYFPAFLLGMAQKCVLDSLHGWP